MKRVATVRCTHVIAQVSLGFYDEEGNLVGEETFPQLNGNIIAGKLFHPHTEQLAGLITECIQQAWAKLSAQGEAAPATTDRNGAGDAVRVGLEDVAARGAAEPLRERDTDAADL